MNIPNFEVKDIQELANFKKDKKKVKKYFKSCVVMATNSVIRLIPRVIGPGLSKMGRFPTVLQYPMTNVTASEERQKMEEEVYRIRSIKKFIVRKNNVLQNSIGNMNCSFNLLYTHVYKVIDIIVEQFPKRWFNIKTIVLKTSMGSPVYIYK